MADSFTTAISFYHETYVDGLTAGPTNADYGVAVLNGSLIGTIDGGRIESVNYAVLGGCQINSTPGTMAQLHNLTDGVNVGNEVELFSTGGNGFSVSVADMGITSLAAGEKAYIVKLRQLCNGDSIAHTRVVWKFNIAKASSGTKVVVQVPLGGNYTVNGTTAAEGSTIKQRWDGWDSDVFKNGDNSPATLRYAAVGKATATRTTTAQLYSNTDAGSIASPSWTETSYTVKTGDVTAPTNGSELKVLLSSSVAATLAYQKGFHLMIYMTQPAAVKHVLVGQNAGLSAVISSTTYVAQDPNYGLGVDADDYDTLSDWRWGNTLLAGASGTTYGELRDYTTAIASTELSHNTTTATLTLLGISDPLPLAFSYNYIRSYNKRATSNGRSFGWWYEFKETITYPVSTRRIFIT